MAERSSTRRLPRTCEGDSWRSIKYFGAGAIVASVTIASGESLFAARCGRCSATPFSGALPPALVMKGVQVYSAGRYMVLTGEHPMTHWAYLPGPKNWVPITIALLSLVCFPFLAGRSAADAWQHPQLDLRHPG